MRAAGAVALSMLLLDAALIYAHVRGSGLGAGPFDLSWLVSGPWRLDAERGRGELFQYLKYLVMTALALRLRERRSWRAAGVLALFSLLLLLDDAFQLHERLGEAVTGPRGSPSALTAGFAELLGFAVLGGVFVWFLVGSWRRGAKERRVAGPVAMLVAGLAFLGAVVDLVSGPLVLHATATFL